MSAWPQWDRQVLVNLGAPTTGDNLRLMDVWHNCEGGLAAFNPLNTTQFEPGATNYNSVGVKNYPSLDVGLRATVATLENGHYNGIVGDLRAGTFSAAEIISRNASQFSTWGTSVGCLSSNVGGTPAPPPGPVTPPGTAPRPVVASPTDALTSFHHLQLAVVIDAPAALRRSQHVRRAIVRLTRRGSRLGL